MKRHLCPEQLPFWFSVHSKCSWEGVGSLRWGLVEIHAHAGEPRAVLGSNTFLSQLTTRADNLNTSAVDREYKVWQKPMLIQIPSQMLISLTIMDSYNAK